MSKPINFSKGNRRQIFTVKLTGALISNLHPETLLKLTDQNIIQVIIDNLIAINKQVCPNFPEFPFEKQYIERFHRMTIDLNSFIQKSFDNEITIDFLNAIIILAEKAHVESLQIENSELHSAWKNVIDNLFLLYKNIDPEFEDSKYMEFGLSASQKIEKILQLI